MEKSNCFTIHGHIYIITERGRGERLNKWGSKYDWYYSIKSMSTGNRVKLTDEGFKKFIEKHEIEWQKTQTDMYNIVL